MTSPHINDKIDESPGGFIESVKRTLVLSLRNALTDSTLSLEGSRLHVDMEYPFEKASYPAAWVQFSFTRLTDSGLGHSETTNINGTEVEVRQWMYEGRVTVNFLSLSSLDRDRISDRFISVYSFAETKPQVIRKETPASKFLSDLEESPYVSLSIQSGTLSPGGQSTSIGTPWDANQLVYEDTYSFNLAGEFQQIYVPGEGYRLRKIEVKPEGPTIPGLSSSSNTRRGEWL